RSWRRPAPRRGAPAGCATAPWPAPAAGTGPRASRGRSATRAGRSSRPATSAAAATTRFLLGVGRLGREHDPAVGLPLGLAQPRRARVRQGNSLVGHAERAAGGVLGDRRDGGGALLARERVVGVAE